jgi:hypothetical protein
MRPTTVARTVRQPSPIRHAPAGSGWRVGPPEPWPALPLAAWEPTLDTVHLLTQIAGKVKLALTPFLNEWWNVALHVTPRGLSTGPIPSGAQSFAIDFDFFAHAVVVQTTGGEVATIPLGPRPVAEFYAELMAALRRLGIPVTISPVPSEIPNPIPFSEDRVHAAYDPGYVQRWLRILASTERLLQRFRTPFAGKSSPVNFFWGSFDLCHTRFSGRPAEPPASWPRFMQLAERQENFACGFWPGNITASGVAFGEPAFYAYVYPAPAGIDQARIFPDAAGYNPALGEFVLRYEHARRAPDPDATILAFFQSCYEAATTLAGWDHDSLEQRDQPGGEEPCATGS